MKFAGSRRAGIVVGAVLGTDCALHLFWATTGSSWPASTEESLSRGLLNADFAITPRVLYPLAAVLLAATLMVLTRSGLFPWLAARVPGWLPTLVTIGVGAAVLIRAIAGIVWIAGIDSSTATWFYRLNLLLYTPACLAMFAGCVAVLRSPRDQDASDARVARRGASHAAR